MLDQTKLYLFIFGAFTILGGVIGFVKAGSKASLIAGGISGALLLLAGYLIGAGNAQVGLILGLVLSLALAGQFLPKFLKTKKIMPPGIMALLSIIGLVLTALNLFKR